MVNHLIILKGSHLELGRPFVIFSMEDPVSRGDPLSRGHIFLKHPGAGLFLSGHSTSLVEGLKARRGQAVPHVQGFL